MIRAPRLATAVPVDQQIAGDALEIGFGPAGDSDRRNFGQTKKGFLHKLQRVVGIADPPLEEAHEPASLGPEQAIEEKLGRRRWRMPRLVAVTGPGHDRCARALALSRRVADEAPSSTTWHRSTSRRPRRIVYPAVEAAPGERPSPTGTTR